MPNYISIVWILMCLKMTFFITNPSFYVIDYILWLVTAIYFIISIGRAGLSAGRLFVLKYFFIIAGIQLAGIMQVTSLFSVRNVISTLCAGLFLQNAIYYPKKIQIKYIRLAYFLFLFIILYNSVRGILLDNTTSGGLMFILLGYILIELHNSRRYKRVNGLWSVKEKSKYVSAVILSFAIIFMAKARTALFVLIIMLLIFFVLCIIRISPENMKVIFYIVAFLALFGTVFYMNISKMSWYNEWNAYSVDLFDKNIDSSRPYLWKYSLDSLSWWQYIVGKGTGTLPEIARYLNNSFHNSFIQILMQNGIIGLIFLVIILKKLWMSIADYADKILGKLLIAFMIGVIVYNCFECTLIQNKVFLGCIQWLVIGLGINFMCSSELGVKSYA